ncbi:MAG: 30S ribosomal protein THX [Cyclobacteriaceae bacterium]
MGKGDIKTRKGKISKGTYGVSRKKKSTSTTVEERPSKKKKAKK